MASSSDRTAPKRPQDDDLRMVAPRSAHCCQLLLLGQHRKAEYLTIEVNRSVEIGHVHHDTQKVHPLLQIFSRAEVHSKRPFLPERRPSSRVAQIRRFLMNGASP